MKVNMKSKIHKLYYGLCTCKRCKNLCDEEFNTEDIRYGFGKLKGLHIGNNFLFVGMNPSNVRGIYGTFAFDGGFGLEFLRMINYLNECTITNIVKCSTKNNKIDERLINKCGNRFLLKEIQILKPKVIVPLGKQVAKFFDAELYKESIFEYNDREAIVFPINHPNYVLSYGGMSVDDYKHILDTLYKAYTNE